MQTVQVSLGSRAYEILIAGGALSAATLRMEESVALRRRPAVVTSPTLAALYPEVLEGWRALGAAVFVTSVDGEKSKSAAELAALWEGMAEARCDRGCLVVAFGGGVIGDLAGFLAASYLRGVDFVQVPTTLLAMVDSSVGGKTGVNLKAGKNLVGAFHQPKAVYADTALLRTLPPREFAAGMAEVVKYALLGDRDLLELLLRSGPLSHSHPELPGIIRRCCEIKAGIVREDEFETAPEGGRALLNLGHTFGHAIENVAGYGEYLHGEAVAVGCVMAARLSVELGLADPSLVPLTLRLVEANSLPSRLLKPLCARALTDAMRKDKKSRGGSLRFVVLREPGCAMTRDGVPEHLVTDLWREFGAE